MDTLERYVEAHPELFVQAIAWTYKRKDGATDPAEFQVPPERIETMAERGHKLLDAIERIPGHNHLGEVEATRLATWIAAVRQGRPPVEKVMPAFLPSQSGNSTAAKAPASMRTLVHTR
ncbi:MAG: hypothetical protein ACLPTQ_04285 [Terriglobales bacterium]